MVVLSELLDEHPSSSSTHDYIYDVFLSFRGLDTRHSFTDHLYKALVEANVRTFLDEEEIETGLHLKPELESAIRASRASFIVLSENYASSTWCLNELVMILDQRRTSGHIVIPIFYHVEPSHIRKQQTSFGDAMTKHNKRMEVETNVEEKSQLALKIKIWKNALIEVADLKGKDVKGWLETDFIEEIVKDIYHRLGLHLRSPLPLLMGVDYSIRFITSWLKDRSSQTFDVLTIFGMGGIGKTSLVKYVYGLHHLAFAKSSFVQDISRRCDQKFNGILDLQSELCGDLSKRSHIKVHDVSVYTSKIENIVARKKVFLVLDDINSLEQLDAMLGRKCFHPGSKVIITTRHTPTLIESWGLFNMKVPPKHTKHLLRGLHSWESLELLCIHAFMCNIPKEGYEKVSDELVKYCDGHPLALEVSGRFLRNRDVAYWEEHIEGLKKKTDSHINNVLRTSFDSLGSDNDKDLFKHIACFFVGEDRNIMEIVLKACGIRTVLGITNLIDRCLLMIGPRNELKMHQLLQEMGRDVVCQESLDKPWKRSRLWCHEESFKVLKQKKGSGKVIGLALDMKMLEKDKLRGSVELKVEALSKMDNLMLLQLNYVQLNGSYENFPPDLRWLCMHGFPLKSIPSNLPMENLVALDMSYSNFESFDMSCNPQQLGKRQKLSGPCLKDKGFLRSLKILNLSFCTQLRSLGGFYELPALEWLILTNCIGLIDVCESIEQCDELVLIDLSYSNVPRNLLRTLVKLKKVEKLLLDGCNLDEFPTEMLTNSQTSSLTIVEAIPRDIRPRGISLPSSLVCLSLKDNRLSNKSFPEDFSSLSMLKELYLDGNSIVSLPSCVRSLPRLEKLSVVKCPMLKTLERPPRTLKHLILDEWHSIQKVVFHREMSPLAFNMHSYFLPYLGKAVEGIIICESVTNIEERVFRSLGWTNLEFIQNHELAETSHLKKSQIQIDYEFGIFSTIYEGMEIPIWISNRSDGSSISFTIPSSPNNLRGLNFCCLFKNPILSYFVQSTMRISNITKNRTWIYISFDRPEMSATECVVFLSHWMFGKNEMEEGDQVMITMEDYFEETFPIECGASLMYDDDDDDDGKKKVEEGEEDVLGYYKSWNHIIGGDLSPFLTTTGEYLLDIRRFFGKWLFTGDLCYVDDDPIFTAFSKRKSNAVCITPKAVME
ncbi:hypothetical protein OSB04_013296 [Centaurea solstitialis]|uniref:TIR domain-containing protein n=1 Tax=Centaurea solstitialis TaxID=347529 RepID=A0AA38WEV2_9ASTR|nr:hypothetical protein OSB04_013296 [Centaurea solstitialis]